MNKNKLTLEEEKHIVKSLTGNDIRLLEFIPYILQDLYELGCSPKYSLELLERNFQLFDRSWKVLELCCGKGAVILSIVEKYGCTGIGIDLFEPFILEADSNARKWYLNNKICLETMDIEMAVKVFSDFDLVIFGFDTDKLGNENESLSKVSKCCKERGFILVESSHKCIDEFEKVVIKSGLQIIDRIIHPLAEIKKQNSMNTLMIRKRLDELKIIHPEHLELFNNYLEAQINECFELENDYITATYLLQTKQ